MFKTGKIICIDIYGQANHKNDIIIFTKKIVNWLAVSLKIILTEMFKGSCSKLQWAPLNVIRSCQMGSWLGQRKMNLVNVIICDHIWSALS
jgi:hypothetical protein